MEFLIVSGLSGAGKSTVMSILEDSGFFCVDNLPPVLIPKFAEVCLAGMGSYERVAMVCDIRAGEQFDGLFQAMDTLKAMEFRYKVLFVDADTAAIIQRYWTEPEKKEPTHPLQKGLVGQMADEYSQENVHGSKPMATMPKRSRGGDGASNGGR